LASSIASVAGLVAACESRPNPPLPTPTSDGIGEVTSVDCDSIKGWIKPIPHSTVRFYSDGDDFNQGTFGNSATPPDNAETERFDFEMKIISPLKDGRTHTLDVFRHTQDRGMEYDEKLENSPQTIYCASE